MMLASRIFEQNHAVEVKMHDDGLGLVLRTRSADQFYLLLNRIVLDCGIGIEAIAPTDDDVHSVYQYLISNEGGRL